MYNLLECVHCPDLYPDSHGNIKNRILSNYWSASFYLCYTFMQGSLGLGLKAYPLCIRSLPSFRNHILCTGHAAFVTLNLSLLHSPSLSLSLPLSLSNPPPSCFCLIRSPLPLPRHFPLVCRLGWQDKRSGIAAYVLPLSPPTLTLHTLYCTAPIDVCWFQMPIKTWKQCIAYPLGIIL